MTLDTQDNSNLTKAHGTAYNTVHTKCMHRVTLIDNRGAASDRYNIVRRLMNQICNVIYTYAHRNAPQKYSIRKLTRTE
jgi:hypothetical protein